MKQLKFIAVLIVALAFQVTSAQEAKNWPKLKDVQQVAARIQKNVDSDNKEAFAFAETLSQQAKLLSKDAPKEYQTKVNQKLVADIQFRTEDLAKKYKEKASYETLKTVFASIQTSLKSLAPNK